MKLLIKPLSKDTIIKWSYGNILNSGTININTLKPEKGGLFCTRIFGPINDYICDCNFLKKYNSGIGKCNKCGVEYILSSSRRIRMASINLAIPLVHYYYLFKSPYVYSLLLNISNSDIIDIVNYKKYILFNIINNKLIIKKIISIKIYNRLLLNYKDNYFLLIGSEAIDFYLSKLSIDIEITNILCFLKLKINFKNSLIKNIFKRLKLLIILSINKIKPIWFMVKLIPVIPPDLRPLIIINSDRIISSGINRIYSNIINSNNRLFKLFSINAPKLVLINAKNNLQKTFNSLFINSSDNLLLNNFKGKYGLLRNNLLGKRVDFSARTVIVVEPYFSIYKCGVPYLLYLELLKPILLYYIIKFNYVSNIRDSNIFLMDIKNKSIIINLLYSLLNKYPSILNRAPTLHRMNIQSFYPYLVSGKSLYINPLICKSFNADFDGDQMAVHIPLFSITRNETIKYLISYLNIFSPSNGKVMYVPSNESMIGLYYLTSNYLWLLSDIKYFYNVNDVYVYYINGAHINEIIFLKITNFYYIKTTVGRSLFFKIIKFNSLFIKYNKPITRFLFDELVGDLFILLNKCFLKLSNLINSLNKLGFKFALKSKLTFSISDFSRNNYIINEYNLFIKKYLLIRKYFLKKIIFNKYKKLKLKILWDNFLNKISFLFKKNNFYYINLYNYICLNYNNIFCKIIISGSKNILSQLIQLILCRGIVLVNIDYKDFFFISNSLYNGLSMLNFFMSSYGSRKGLCDTSINTSLSGYFTRKLVSLSRDLIINHYNCNSKGIRVYLYNNNLLLIGKFLSINLYDFNGRLIYKKNTLVNKVIYNNILKSFNYIDIRTPSKCILENGVCILCYGLDLNTKEIIRMGTSVGIIASQSLGEPGTQLTMRTFHTGGFLPIVGNLLYYFFGYGIIKFSSSLQYYIINNSYYIINTGYILIYNIFGSIIYIYKLFNNNIILINNLNIFCYLNIFIYKFNYFRYIYINNIFLINYKYSGIDIDSLNIKRYVYFFNDFKQKRPFILIKLYNCIRLIRIISGTIINYFNNYIILKVPLYNTIVNYNNLLRMDHIFEINSLYLCNKNIYSDFKYLSILVKSNYRLFNYYNISFINIYGSLNIIGYNNNFINILDIYNSNYISNYIIDNFNINNINKLYLCIGMDLFINFIIKEITSLLFDHGIIINSKHIELIIKRLLGLVLVYKLNKHNYFLLKTRFFLYRLSLNKFININHYFNYYNINKYLIYKNILFGISKMALLVDSFISAAAFRETLGILFKAAINCYIDSLNTVVGKLIFSGLPILGTGIFIKNVNY